MVGIIDYGMGNLHSVRNAFASIGCKASIIAKPEVLKKFPLAVLPGVGAFGDAMKALNASGMTQAIKDYIATGKFFMGICLGLQLLFEKSQESPGVKGLGLIKGNVVRFTGDIKVPHIGWNQLEIRKRDALLRSVKTGAFVYFCHSYYVVPKKKDTCIAMTRYSRAFAAMVAERNVFGIQFHPEKSQKIGLTILKNFTRGQ